MDGLEASSMFQLTAGKWVKDFADISLAIGTDEAVSTQYE